MAEFLLTTNVDLRNFRDTPRLETIRDRISPDAVELYLLPSNYPSPCGFELSGLLDVDETPVLGRRLAVGLGAQLMGFSYVQVHYPWQFSPDESRFGAMSQTIEFCDILKEEGEIGQVSINYHFANKSIGYSKLSLRGLMSLRNEAGYKLDSDSRSISLIKRYLGSDCLLVGENNPGTAPDRDSRTGEILFDPFDLVPLDFRERPGLDGLTLDVAHAYNVWLNLSASLALHLRDEDMPRTLVSVAEQYIMPAFGSGDFGDVVGEFSSLPNAPLRWIHVSDERDPNLHEGLHIGDGKIDYAEVFRRINQTVPEDAVIPVTIETKDGHTDEGFQRILENDVPRLREAIQKV